MFNYYKKQFKDDILLEFTIKQEARIWLKIKSITRKEYLLKFIKTNNFAIKSTKLEKQFEELFNLSLNDLNSFESKINNFINSENIISLSKSETQKIVDELYKMSIFHWGGDYKNALDKHLVDKYVKVYKSYEILNGKIETEVYASARGYVLCSWYNHWSSIIIENLFKTHKSVLSAIGQVKKVDFFIQDIPFDLKTTYLPENFLIKKRKQTKLKTELQELKYTAKKLKISFDKNSSDTIIFDQIKAKLQDSEDGQKTLDELREFRKNLVQELIQNPRELIQNLYEEQGELRFDASNRLFLVLIDTQSFDLSWQLKRNLPLLEEKIKQYLDNFHTKKLEDLQINFTYKNKGNFTAFADIIFILK